MNRSHLTIQRVLGTLLATLLLAAAMPRVASAQVAFTKVALPVTNGRQYTGVAVGPDGKLYTGNLAGQIVRFPINGDGTLGAAEVLSPIIAANGGARAIIAITFDPAATAGNLILWVTHSGAPLTNSPDWLGKITRLSGPNLATVQDYVVNLPRSIRDHMTNGLVFHTGEPGVVYVEQGSNSTMGAPDGGWGNRPERLLTAAVLRVDLNLITSPPLDVKTAEGGTYDPFAPGAPVTVFASGTRNCYDLVWHTNGQLYVSCNGSAPGGNTPAATVGSLPPQCATRRLDLATNGPYTGPSVSGLTGVPTTQHEFLFRAVQGGYYGHPNPERCEWVLNGGNPTSGSDTAQVSEYPVGTQPDRNWRGAAWDYGQNFSPNGILEYRSTAFGGALQGKLIVARYSGGDDLIVLTPGGPNLDIVSAQTGITGMTGFTDPLDLAENVATGDLYVTEHGGQRVTLLRPQTPPTGCVTAADCTGALPACGQFQCTAGVCSVVPVAAGPVCRTAADVCDQPESCNGASTTCPADLMVPSGTPCASDGNACTVDQCNGVSPACQHPAGNAGAICRPLAGPCDLAETCTGASPTCPADGFGSGECRPSAGLCDPAETCTGTSAACPPDTLASGGVCRPSLGECDVAETCPGGSPACPADGTIAAGTACSSDGNACTTDACDGAGVCAHTVPPGMCSDGDPCTSDVCSPATGCSNPPLGGQPCDTGEEGVCADGVTACAGGNVTCEQTTQPSTETCGNALDDDCNGEVDDPSLCGNVCQDTTTNGLQTKITKVTFKEAADRDKLSTQGTFTVAPGTFDPTTSEVAVIVHDGSGAEYYTAAVPAGRFTTKNGRSFKFKDQFAPYEEEGLRDGQFSVKGDGVTVKYKFNAQALNLPPFVPGVGSVTVKVGDRCYVDGGDACGVSPTTVKCR